MFVIPITVADRVGSLANFRGCSFFPPAPLFSRTSLYNGTRKRPRDWMDWWKRREKAGFAKKGRATSEEKPAKERGRRR